MLQSAGYATGSPAITEIHSIAKHGYAVAQYNLGIRYGVGNGSARDDQQAAVWYRRDSRSDATKTSHYFPPLKVLVACADLSFPASGPIAVWRHAGARMLAGFKN